jgi:hypothetical protein
MHPAWVSSVLPLGIQPSVEFLSKLTVAPPNSASLRSDEAAFRGSLFAIGSWQIK